MQVNDNNFLRWFNDTPDLTQPPLPHGYWRDPERCGYMPIAFPTEAISFYVNSPGGVAGIDITNIEDFRLDIKRVSDGFTIEDIAPVQEHQIATGYSNLFSTAVIPVLPDGVYQLVIAAAATGDDYLTSSLIKVVNDKAKLDRETTYCRFRHDRFFYGISYHQLPGFYQQFRLHVNVLEAQYETDVEIYKEVTTGKSRRFNGYMGKYYEVETYYFDESAHDAAAVMFEHSFLQLNGKIYSRTDAYEVQGNPLSKVTKGKISLYDDAFAAINRC